jgi:peptide/nickel transport system ATP-binding protein
VAQANVMTDGGAAAAAPTPLLRVQNLATSFLTPLGKVPAVDGVSFEVMRGESIGIVGESGSGKSVLVRSVMKLVPSTATVSGQVQFDGRDLTTLPPKELRRLWGAEIGMVFQDPMTSLNPVRRIGKQLTDPIRQHLHLSKSQARARALELLDLVGIPEAPRRMEQYPHELSGGMRQRILIAIAVSCWPKLLIADEPTTALDVTVQRQILDLLTRLQHELEMSLILITHDLGVVAGRSRRVLVMYGGRVVEEANTADLFTDTRHPYSEGLLASIPRIEQPSHTRQQSIAGRPPDLRLVGSSCRFAPRCQYARDRCREEDPVLEPTGQPGHRVACFYPVGGGSGVLTEVGVDPRQEM